MSSSQKLDPSASPHAFAEALRELDRRRALFTFDDARGAIVSPAPELAQVAEAINLNRRDFAGHRAVFFELGRDTGALLSAFLHRVRRGQGAGGVRHWQYASVADAIADGLRLSRGMGRKNALAGLWWGGGKGIICAEPERDRSDEGYRRALYHDYGHFISGLRGAYITAEDVGTRPSDMNSIHETTRFLTCVPEEAGGSGNPSQSTAHGVVCAMRAALQFAGLGTLSGKVIAMQGVGNVGGFMIERLLAEGVKAIIACDVSSASITAAKERFAGAPVELRAVEPGDESIFSEPCDVFAPNALGGILHPGTIPKLACRVVCGAANNQLLDDESDDQLLSTRGIVHVPDYVANRMGIVQCANEQYGTLPNDPAVLRHFDPSYDNSVHRVTLEVLERSKKEGTTPTRAANQLADERMNDDHPLWPGRTQQIIDALCAEGWERG
jgi:glutamate dehydrogenase/leucine dehydrogenase